MEYLYALIGGLLIGLSATILLAFAGRIAGISGIVGGLFEPNTKEEINWRLLFILGLLLGGLLITNFLPQNTALYFHQSIGATILAGIFVGIGTRLGSGCTSGHGVCGLGRRSLRSLMATFTFIAIGVLTVLIKGILSQ